MLCSLSGDDRCFLFSVSPRMAVYTCTGYNDHYMYLNQGQQTIPNGLVRMGAGGGARPPRCRPPLGDSPGPDVPRGTRLLIGQRVVSSPSCPDLGVVTPGATARTDLLPWKKTGPLLGCFCTLCANDGFRQFPGHQVVGLWHLWLETPPWNSCRGRG